MPVIAAVDIDPQSLTRSLSHNLASAFCLSCPERVSRSKIFVLTGLENSQAKGQKTDRQLTIRSWTLPRSPGNNPSSLAAEGTAGL